MPLSTALGDPGRPSWYLRFAVQAGLARGRSATAPGWPAVDERHRAPHGDGARRDLLHPRAAAVGAVVDVSVAHRSIARRARTPARSATARLAAPRAVPRHRGRHRRRNPHRAASPRPRPDSSRKQRQEPHHEHHRSARLHPPRRPADRRLHRCRDPRCRPVAAARPGRRRRDPRGAAAVEGRVLPRPGARPRPSTSRSSSSSARRRPPTRRCRRCSRSFPEILLLDNQRMAGGEAKKSGPLVESRWHTDVTFVANPPMGSILRGVVVPPYGGDTQWINLAVAYEQLSTPIQSMIDGLHAVHHNQLPVKRGEICRRRSPSSSSARASAPCTPSCGCTPRPARRCCSSTRTSPATSSSCPGRRAATCWRCSTST